MKCPVCEHESGKALLKCAECANVFDRETLEEYEHLDYLLAWLRKQAESLEPAVGQQLKTEAQRRQKHVIQDSVGPGPITIPIIYVLLKN